MSEWIKVSDRLPEEVGAYLVAYRAEKFLGGGEMVWYVTDGTYYPDGNVWFVGGEPNRLIAHWMPFPDPPKENNANQT